MLEGFIWASSQSSVVPRSRSCLRAVWVNPVPNRLRNNRSRAVASRAVEDAGWEGVEPVPGLGSGGCGWAGGCGAGRGGGAGFFFGLRWGRFLTTGRRFFLRRFFFLRGKRAIGVPTRRGGQ